MRACVAYVAVLLTSLTACGGDGTSAGTGTRTLLVTASINDHDGNASVRVTVERAGRTVTDAAVTIEGDRAGTALVQTDSGTYAATLPGWAGVYTLRVASGPDHLEGSIVAPQPAPITAPTPTVAFDPHLAPGGLVQLRWAGALADTVEVKSKEFEWGPTADPGQLTIAATVFIESSQEVKVSRQNSTPLAGGVAGSVLTAGLTTTTDLLVLNPYPH